MTKIRLSTQIEVEIKDRAFASGATGDLFFSADGSLVAKIYRSPELIDRNQLSTLLLLHDVLLSRTEVRDSVVWPYALVQEPSLGVVMVPLPEGMKSLNWFVSRAASAQVGKAERGTWLDRVAVAAKIAQVVSQMHQLAIVITDLCPHNIFVSLPERKLLFIDCDSFLPPGHNSPHVGGHRGYQAPEVVMGSAITQLTDLHSLAVTIYRLLFLHHPLLGTGGQTLKSSEDDHVGLGEELDLLELGIGAHYVDHPDQRFLRSRGLQILPRHFSQALEDICQRAFVVGLHAPQERPKADEWHQVLVDLMGMLRACTNEECLGRYSVPKFNNPVCYWCASPYLVERKETIDHITLLRVLLESFSDDEISDVAFEIDIEIEDLSGNNRKARARALVTHLKHRGRLGDLVDYLRTRRPDAYIKLTS